MILIIEKVISNIGTEILLKTCFSHNSTHKAPPELIPELTTTKFHVDSEFNEFSEFFDLVRNLFLKKMKNNNIIRIKTSISKDIYVNKSYIPLSTP